MEQKNQTVIKLAQTAILAALCYVSFTFLQIKIPMPGGDATSIHIGNAFCVLAALLLGGAYGGLAGAIGMGVADLMDPIYITAVSYTHLPRFEKEAFKKEVTNNVKTLFRRTVDEATPQQLFQAVSYAVKEVIIDDWLATQKKYDEDDPKMVYYMSMEFLMGRALGNNLINMTAYTEVKEALDEMGIDLNACLLYTSRCV